MKSSIKKEWIKALRSGEYKQGDGALCQHDEQGGFRFCCLGVLADIALDGDWERNQYGEYQLVVKTKGGRVAEGCYLTPFTEQLGLDEATQVSLAEMNDEKYLAFEQIADWIGENVK